ncbi:MAG: DNA polymerase III subunit alpha [Rickettsiales bacterium]|jgi:DNA polymerase-3 subunit alpha|nr:DNA polymerase III subunit alpha [Rickettsiales bacterium]
MSQQFVHLRVHSKYSIGEGTLYIDANPKKDPNRQTIVKLCKAYGMPACALTDTNLMSGTAEMSDALPNGGIQPIIGLEATLNHHESMDAKQLRSEQLSRIVLLAQNHTGYLNLTALNSMQYMREGSRHLGPYITIEEIAAHSDGIVCLSGAHTGPIGMAILNGQDNLASDFARRFKQIFGDRFYMEIQRHGIPSEIKTEPAFLKLAADMNIPIVATNDACFALPENYEAEDAIASVLQQTKIIDPERTRKSSQQYFKSPEEMAELFDDLPEALENTVGIANRCAYLVDTKSKPLLPKFGNDFDTECQMLRDNARKGLDVRMSENKITEPDQKKYFDQLEFELDVIIKMGFPGYFLIVADYINWCKQNDILVGPGRGSGPGSVVAWALGITNVNPMEYGLLFERFLNPDRISMPDFDVDFEPDQIPRIMDYICSKYGADHICRIITFGSLQARGAIRDIGRVYGMPYSKTDRFAKLIPMDAKKISDAIEKSDEIQDVLDTDADLKKVVDISMEIEGAFRNLGQHACGVVIGDRPTTQIAPIYRDPSNEMPSCQFDGHYLESVGLIKFDFLGLETLTVLKYACKMIKENYGTNIDLDFIPLEDEKTFNTIWRPAKTIGIFQYDGSALPWLRQMKPTCFSNIIALNALNRPGPMAYIPQYIARMHGEEPVSYPHPLAEEILKETYGIIVYQEQVMQLSRALAGFTRGESDTLRKGMGKKIKEVMDKMRVKFVDGCAEQNTLSREQAEEMYQQFVKFAEYAFNKAHSVVYAVIAAQCGYIKAHYPAEFLAASMSSNMNDSDQLAVFINDAKSNFNLEIVPPDINNSESLFTVKNGKIIFALAAIKGVGKSATDQIIAERRANGKFQNITDFAKRCAPFVNKRVLEAFAKVGAFDSLLPNRAQIFMNTDLILNFAIKSKEAGNSLSLFEDTATNDVAENRLQKNMTKVAHWNFGEQLANEHSVLGFYISAHPMDQYNNLISRTGLTTSATLSKKRDRENVQIAVSVNTFNRRTTKAGKLMCAVNASDSHGNIDAVAFGDFVPQIAAQLAAEPLVLLSGRASARDDRTSIFIDSVQPLGAWIAGVASRMTLDVYKQEILPDVKNALDALRPGNTKVIINIHGEKSVQIALSGAVALSLTIGNDLAALGVKAAIE